MSLAAATRADIERARDRYPQARSAILPALWAVQHEIGHLTPDAMAEVATLLHLTPGDVEAVATFYSMYFQHARGRHEVLVCINVSCALRGADDIVAHLERSLGVPSGGTTADGAFTWGATVECLGACGGAPAMQLDHAFVENLTPDRVDAVLRDAGDQSHGSGPGPAASGSPPPPLPDTRGGGRRPSGVTRPASGLDPAPSEPPGDDDRPSGKPGAMELPRHQRTKRQRSRRDEAER